MNEHPTDPPITEEPRRVRPPYNVRDTRLDHLHATDTAAWRVAVRLDRLTALLEPLDGLETTDLEYRTLAWLAGWETPTVAVVASLLRRARAADPARLTPDEVAVIDAEADRILGPDDQDDDVDGAR